ncbi:hypothetical protein GCM10010493_76830 [Streptomyces lavendulae subsp. grasserius]
MVTGTVLFVPGFTAVLVSRGALFGCVGRSLPAHQGEVTLVLGLLTVLMGPAFTGLLPGFAQREFRSPLRPASALAGAPCRARSSPSAGRRASARLASPSRPSSGTG